MYDGFLKNLEIPLQGFMFAHQGHAFVKSFKRETVADEAIYQYLACCQQVKREAQRCGRG